MAFDINTFRSAGLVYGGARPALFEVTVTPPGGIGIDIGSVAKFGFTCQAANLPEFNVGIVPVGYFGRKIKVAGDREFADWQITVMNDEDFSVRAMFEKWSNAINALRSNIRQAGLDLENYKADFGIIQYAKDGEVIRSYQMIGGWPSVVSAIDNDWNNTNQYETFNVTLPYDWCEPVTESSSKTAGGINQYLGNI